MPTQEALLQQYNGKVPDDMEVVQGSGQEPGFYLLRKTAGITGQDLRTAQATLDENGRPAVGLRGDRREGGVGIIGVLGDDRMNTIRSCCRSRDVHCGL